MDGGTLGGRHPLKSPQGRPSIQVEFLLASFDAIDVGALERVLAADERARAIRYRTEGARRAFVAGRGLTRILLAERTGAAAEALRFEAASSGKPRAFLPTGESAPPFSVSHSGRVVAIALSRGAEVGIDAEPVDREVDALAVATRYFPDAERAVVERAPAHERRRAFLELWTLREAVVKARGATMAEAFGREFAFTRHGVGSAPFAGDVIHVHALGRPFHVTRFDAEDHIVAVAVTQRETDPEGPHGAAVSRLDLRRVEAPASVVSRAGAQEPDGFAH